MAAACGPLWVILMGVWWSCVSAQYDKCAPGEWGNACTPCGHCEGGANCNTISGRCETGCELGYRMPLCTTNCEEGTYGKNCANRCGACSIGSTCDKLTGACPEARCQRWYVSGNGTSHCTIFIEQISVNVIPTVLFVKSTWARLELPVQLSPTALSHYTFHTETLSEPSGAGDASEGFLAHDALTAEYHGARETLTLTLTGLQPVKQYWVRVSISRSHQGVTEAGKASKPVLVQTPADDITTGNMAAVVKSTLGLQVICVLGLLALAVWLIVMTYRARNNTTSSATNHLPLKNSEVESSRVTFGLG